MRNNMGRGDRYYYKGNRSCWYYCWYLLDTTLADHGISNLDEAGNVGTGLNIALKTVFLGSTGRRIKDVLHDRLEFLVDLLAGPLEAGRVLGHLEARDGDTAGVGGLGGTKHGTIVLENFDGLRSRGHVGAFEDTADTVGNEGVCIGLFDLVLGGRGEGEVTGNFPRTLVGDELSLARELAELRDTTALDGLEVNDIVDLLAGEAVGLVDIAVRVGEGDGNGAEVNEFLSSILGNVAGARDQAALALNRLATVLEVVLGKVDAAVASSFGADEGATKVQGLTGEDTSKLIGETFVLPKEITDLPTTNIDIASGDIGVRPNMTIKFGHEGLAEAHHFIVRPAAGVKVGATLTSAHHQGGEGVLEDLLEGKELDDREVDGGVEAKPALVGTESRGHLDAETAVDLLLSLIVDPGDTEDDLALRFNHALKSSDVLGVLFEDRLQRVDDLRDGLLELGLVGITKIDGIVDALNALIDRHGAYLIEEKRNAFSC